MNVERTFYEMFNHWHLRQAIAPMTQINVLCSTNAQHLTFSEWNLMYADAAGTRITQTIEDDFSS